jgi:hypothetical protein
MTFTLHIYFVEEREENNKQKGRSSNVPMLREDYHPGRTKHSKMPDDPIKDVSGSMAKRG